MKRIWIATIIFLAMVGICVLEMICVNITVSGLQEVVDDAIECIEKSDTENAMVFTKKSSDLWKYDHEKLAIFIPHVELQEIDRIFAAMQANLECGETNDFLAASYMVNIQLDQLKDDEFPTISNIL